jgi:hypothetical protein
MSLGMLALLLQPAPSGQPLPGDPCTGTTLVGSWQFVERTEGPPPSLGDLVVYKHITPTHFVVLRVDPKGSVASAHGGPIKLERGTLTETLDHFTAHERYATLTRGATITFQCAVDGDQLRIRGDFNGQKMAEHWRRVRAPGGTQ